MNQFSKLILICILQLSFFTGMSQEVNSAYIVQNGDWLSKISQKAYGNPHLYYSIIESTNKKNISDKSFQKISDVRKIKIGQKLWIPAYKSPDKEKGDVLVSIPVTDCEIRIWYNYQIIAISELNKNWIQQGFDLKTRALKAYELRHEARMNARFMMADKEAVKKLQDRDQDKYGNPHGPTFVQLLKKCTDKGSTADACYQKVIDSSSRVSTVYNNECID